ncbi:MAG: O-antigen ligase family protein [Planctomycetota bacterium]
MTMVAPPELSIHAGSLRLSPYRLLLMVSVLPCLLLLLRQRRGWATVVDLLFLLHCFWVILTFIVHHGFSDGIESGGIYAFEILGAYWMGRCFVKDAVSFRFMVGIMTAFVVTIMVFSVPETVTGKHLIRDSARAVFGGPGLPFIEKRFGLTRAFGPFEHPIGYGVFCASTIALAFYALPGGFASLRRLARTALLVVATTCSLSSGALAAMSSQLFLVGWETATRSIAFRWLLLFSLAVAGWVAIDLASNRTPMKVALTYLTFSPATAYNRLLIFEYGSAEVRRHPWLGIGFNDWERPSWMSRSGSMDNFWLVVAVRHGMPAFVTLAGAIVILMWRVSRAPWGPRTSALRNGWMITLGGLCLSACTVHYWNAQLILFVFLVGAGGWLVGAARDHGFEDESLGAGGVESEAI